MLPSGETKSNRVRRDKVHETITYKFTSSKSHQELGIMERGLQEYNSSGNLIQNLSYTQNILS